MNGIRPRTWRDKLRDMPVALAVVRLGAVWFVGVWIWALLVEGVITWTCHNAVVCRFHPSFDWWPFS